MSHRTAEAALAVVKSLLDPILGDAAGGSWDPDALAWIDENDHRSTVAHLDL